MSSEGDSESSVSLLGPGRKNKRQVMKAHGIETWSHKHSAGLTCALTVTVICIGLSLLREHFEEEEEAESLQVGTTPFPPEDQSGWDTKFEILGCYPLMNGDDTSNPKLRDPVCMNKTKNLMGIPCRSGLPFYRLSFVDETETELSPQSWHLSPVSWRFCAAFCLFKGFDIAGVVMSTECRCGATEKNVGIWHVPNISATRLELLWQPPWNEVPSGSSRCAILATRFTGPVPMEGVNFDRTSQDVAYVRGIVRGEKVEAKADLVGVRHAAKAQKKIRLGGASGAHAAPPQAAGLQQAWLKSSSLARASKSGAISLQATPPQNAEAQGADLGPCYPGQCSGGAVWPIHTDFIGTGIPYFFSDTVPEETRAVFREVIEVLHGSTCIRFTEVSPWYNKTYKIRVRGDASECFTNFLGYPGAADHIDSEVNLGWCRTENEKGDIMHELCHALGMGHEQTRPDRDQFVLIKWYTLEGETERHQFDMDPQAYVGSSQAGPAPYDYESIMHYPLSPNMMTRPIVNGHGAHDSQIGQRQTLSVGDVFQLRNMYRCDIERDLPCKDDDAGVNELGLYEMDDGSNVTCEFLASQQQCVQRPYDQEVRYFCAKSCHSCPVREKSDIKVVGCEDQPGLETVCELYKDFCPGKVSGREDYMTQRCRRTCFIKEFCGTSTTVRGTTTTAMATRPPNIKTVKLQFKITVGDGFKLTDTTDKQLLRSRIKELSQQAFKTSAEVTLDNSGKEQATTNVELECGCDPAMRLPCSIDCATLKEKVQQNIKKGAAKLNSEFVSMGFSVMQVTDAIMVGGDQLQKTLTGSAGSMTISLLGGMGLAASCVMGGYYFWLHSSHADDDEEQDGTYNELSEMGS